KAARLACSAALERRTMTDHQGYRELAAPFALDALTVAERAAFEAHLAECAICRADVQAFREVAGALAYAAPAAALPAELRDRVRSPARPRGPDLPAVGHQEGPSPGERRHIQHAAWRPGRDHPTDACRLQARPERRDRRAGGRLGAAHPATVPRRSLAGRLA